MTEEDSPEGVRSEDTGLPVVNDTGDEIGVIDDVEDDHVTIDPNEPLDDDTLTALGWDDPGAMQTLPRSMLTRVSSDTESYVKLFRFDASARE